MPQKEAALAKIHVIKQYSVERGATPYQDYFELRGIGKKFATTDQSGLRCLVKCEQQHDCLVLDEIQLHKLRWVGH